MMQIQISRGLGTDSHYYVSLDRVVLAVSKVTIFRLGLALYHVAMGNWQMDDAGLAIEVPDLRVMVLGGSYHRESSETSVSPKHRFLGEGHTLHRVATWLLFETFLGGLLLSLLEGWVGLAVVQADWLAGVSAGHPGL